MKTLNKISKQLAIMAIILVMGLSYANKASGQCDIIIDNQIIGCSVLYWEVSYWDPNIGGGGAIVTIGNTTQGALVPGLNIFSIPCNASVTNVIIYDIGLNGDNAILTCGGGCSDFFGSGPCSNPPGPPYVVFLANWQSQLYVTLEEW